MPALGRAGRGQSQELGSQFESPIWETQIQLVEPSLLLLRVCNNRKLELAIETGIKPKTQRQG